MAALAVVKQIQPVAKSTRPHPAQEPQKMKYGRPIEDWEKERDTLEAYEAVRDDIMSLVKNSGLSFEDIHARCGPHPHTLELWARKEIRKPQMGKMLAVLRILGFKEFVINL